MANEVTKLNGIAIAGITDLNGITDANLAKINGQEFTGSTDASLTTMTNYDVPDATRGWSPWITYDPNTDQHILVYGDDNNSDYGTVRTVIRNGNAFVFGDEYVYQSGTNYLCMAYYDDSRDKVALASVNTSDYNNIYLRSFDVGAKQSSTNPYDFSSGDFDTATNATGNTSAYIQQCGQNFWHYNPNYDTYLLMYEDNQTSGYNFIAACTQASDGTWTVGTRVQFENSTNDIFSAVYDDTIDRTVMLYGKTSSHSSTKFNVVKQSGTGNRTITLAGEIGAAHTDNNPSENGRMMCYYPEGNATLYMAANGTIYIARFTGNDGSGYSLDYHNDFGNFAYYMNMGAHDHHSLHYVKGRGRVAYTWVDTDDVKGCIIEWDGDTSNRDAEDVIHGYTGSLGGGTFTLTHRQDSQYRMYGCFGETERNERDQALFGAVMGYGSIASVDMIKTLEVGDNGTSGTI